MPSAKYNAYVLMTNHVHMLITPHTEHYFKAHVPSTLDSRLMVTNKAWVLGNDYFKDLIEQQINRQAKPKDKDGDRKSIANKVKSIESDPIVSECVY